MVSVTLVRGVSTPMDTFVLSFLGPKDDTWMVDRPQIELIVDSQVVCKLLTGQAALDNPKCQPQLREALKSIEVLLDVGWTPRYLMLPLIKWRPRKFNTLADQLATSAMKLCTDLNFIDAEAVRSMNWSRSQIQLFSDGGSNMNENIASIGFVAILWHFDGRVWIRRPILAGARFYPNLRTAFDAEKNAASQFLSLVSTLVPKHF